MDYRYLGACQYGVPSHNESQVTDCAENAIVKVWWESEDKDSLLLCPEHFEFVIKSEKEIPEVD